MQKFDEFMEEVQEDIRQAKFEKYWKLYGKQAVIVCAVILGAAITHTFYKNRQEKKLLEASEKFIAAQNAVVQGNLDDGLVILKGISLEAPGFYKTLAQFAEAGVLLKKNTSDSIQAAIEIFKAIELSSAEKDYKELAELIRYGHEIELTQNFDALRLRLEEIIKAKGPWYAMALEVKGLILHKMGSYVDAASIFVQIAQDKNASSALKLRAQLMSQILAAKLKINKA